MVIFPFRNEMNLFLSSAAFAALVASSMMVPMSLAAGVEVNDDLACVDLAFVCAVVIMLLVCLANFRTDPFLSLITFV